jgi:hypothetical protein
MYLCPGSCYKDFILIRNTAKVDYIGCKEAIHKNMNANEIDLILYINKNTKYRMFRISGFQIKNFNF